MKTKKSLISLLIPSIYLVILTIYIVFVWQSLGNSPLYFVVFVVVTSTFSLILNLKNRSSFTSNHVYVLLALIWAITLIEYYFEIYGGPPIGTLFMQGGGYDLTFKYLIFPVLILVTAGSLLSLKLKSK